MSADNQILGSYLHGLFDKPKAAASLLKWAGLKVIKTINVDDIREQQLERLADCLEQHLSTDLINSMVREGCSK